MYPSAFFFVVFSPPLMAPSRSPHSLQPNLEDTPVEPDRVGVRNEVQRVWIRHALTISQKTSS